MRPLVLRGIGGKLPYSAGGAESLHVLPSHEAGLLAALPGKDEQLDDTAPDATPIIGRLPNSPKFVEGEGAFTWLGSWRLHPQGRQDGYQFTVQAPAEEYRQGGETQFRGRKLSRRPESVDERENILAADIKYRTLLPCFGHA